MQTILALRIVNMRLKAPQFGKMESLKSHVPYIPGRLLRESLQLISEEIIGNGNPLSLRQRKKIRKIAMTYVSNLKTCYGNRDERQNLRSLNSSLTPELIKVIMSQAPSVACVVKRTDLHWDERQKKFTIINPITLGQCTPNLVDPPFPDEY